MSLKQKGFTLLETLIALALSSAVLLGAGKLFPALQRGVLMQYQKETLQESLWQLAFSLGKNLRRAGYCNGQCAGNGLTLGSEGKCVIIRWDFNSNGVWEPAGHAETEMTGFRLREGSLETLKGAVHCDGGNWQRISDPDSMAIKQFVVRRLAREGLPPLLEIEISALPKRGSQMTTLRHSVVGYNL